MRKTGHQEKALPFEVVDGRRVLTLAHHIQQAERRELSHDVAQSLQAIEEDGDSEDTSVRNAQASQQADDDGHVRQRWRLISSVMATPTNAWGIRLLVDYSHDNGRVIRQAVKVINAAFPDLMKDHSDSIEAVVGHVENAEWEDSTDIPPGVNADLVIDPELFPLEAKRLAKGGVYRSGSIGITTQMRKSHEDMDDWEFIEKQGRKVDGEIVRCIPTKLVSVDHMAIIPAGRGADKNAGVRNTEVPELAGRHRTGGGQMPKWLGDLLNKACELLKINWELDASSNDETPPEGVVEKVLDRIRALNATYAKYASVVEKLERIAEDGGLRNADETGLTLEEILNRLPERMEKAKHGDAFLVHMRTQALKAFDTAKVDPKKAEMSELDKKMRARIANSIDLDFLSEQLEHFSEVGKQRLGSNRSSEAEALPNVSIPQVDRNKGPQADIAQSVRAMFRGGGVK